MGKYFVGDYVQTKENKIGIIVDIWELSKVVTVFKVYILSDGKKKDMFYGEIKPIRG